MIFDLWDTLVLWDEQSALRGYALLAERAGVDEDRFVSAWRSMRGERDAGVLIDNIRAALRALGADETLAEALCEVRREHTRTMLVPRDGAAQTLEELRRRGLKRSVISVCSQDVADVWAEFALAPHLDDVVLSCSVGLRKPDPQIYLLACERLGVEPGECLFVGDGANDELAGAERVGMKAVCILRPGADEALWPEARGWEPTIRSIPDVLELAQEID